LESILIPLGNISIGLPIWNPSDKLLSIRLLNGQRIEVSSGEFANGLSSRTEATTPFSGQYLVYDNKPVGIVECNELNGTVTIHLKRGI
jgi:hypothetical protein